MTLPGLRWVGPLFGSLIALASSVQAQSPQRVAQQIEIAGVHLGMPQEQAVKALMANEPSFVDDVVGGNSSALQLKVPVLSADPFVWSMSFRSKPIANVLDEPIEKVELHFAPPPSESTVLTLKRSTCFDCGNGKAMAHAPLVTNFLDALAKRFGSPNASIIHGRNINSAGVVFGEMRYYAWTRNGELLTEQEFLRRMKYPAQCTGMTTPDNARSSNGINFRAFEATIGQKAVIDNCATMASVQWSQDGKGVIRHFFITLTDYAGILSAFSRSSEVVEGKANQQRRQELDRATKNPTRL